MKRKQPWELNKQKYLSKNWGKKMNGDVIMKKHIDQSHPGWRYVLRNILLTLHPVMDQAT